jgi:YHS domain-containing protein
LNPSSKQESKMDRRVFLTVASVLLASTQVLASAPEISTEQMAGIGAGGYDPVSYLDPAGPKMGDAKNSLDWKGASWHFANAANLATFKANPEKYAPQYGGYCAYAVSKGATAPGDPKVFTIVEGKVYFNFSKEVKMEWKKDVPGNISLANGNWPKVLK